MPAAFTQFAKTATDLNAKIDNQFGQLNTKNEGLNGRLHKARRQWQAEAARRRPRGKTQLAPNDVLACDTLYGVKFTVETTDILFFLRRWLRQFFSWLFAKAAARYDYRDLYQAASFMALRRLGSIVCNTDCPVVHKALVDRGVGRRGITFFAFVVYAVYCRPGVGGFNPQLTPVEDLTDVLNPAL
jgi:hypothetical protein